MGPVRGFDPGQVLLVPVDVGKSEAMAMVTDLRSEIVTSPFKFALTIPGSPCCGHGQRRPSRNEARRCVGSGRVGSGSRPLVTITARW